MLLNREQNYGQFLQKATVAWFDHNGMENLETEQTLSDEELNDLRVSCQREKFACSTARRISNELLGAQTIEDRDPYSLHQKLEIKEETKDLRDAVNLVLKKYREDRSSLDFTDLAILQRFLQSGQKQEDVEDRVTALLDGFGINANSLLNGDQLFLPIKKGTDQQIEVYKKRLLDKADETWLRTHRQHLSANDLERVSTIKGQKVDTQGATFRNIPEGLAYRDREAMLKDLEAKTIIDLGSGYNLIARQMRQSGVNAQILNVNPALSMISQGVDIDFGKDTETFEEFFDSGTFTQKNIEDFWTHLDQYPIAEKSIDRVVSFRGFPLYAVSRFEVLKVLQDLRVLLKDDGEIRLGPFKLKTGDKESLIDLEFFDKIANKAGFYISEAKGVSFDTQERAVILKKSLEFPEKKDSLTDS